MRKKVCHDFGGRLFVTEQTKLKHRGIWSRSPLGLQNADGEPLYEDKMIAARDQFETRSKTTMGARKALAKRLKKTGYLPDTSR